MWLFYTSNIFARWRLVLVTVAGALVCVSTAVPALGQDVDGTMLRAADYDAFTYVPPISALRKTPSPVVAVIEVSYDEDFPVAARRAFDFAADIWATHLESPVPIRVHAFWESLEEGVLGSAGATCIDISEAYLPLRETWYPIALAEALAGRNLECPGTEADIQAIFNSDREDWYFGLDGNTPAGMFDFATVALHELGHGLGFVGSFVVDDGVEGEEEPDECPDAPGGYGCWGFELQQGQEFPIVFDRFVETQNGAALLNTALFPNPSPELAEVLQGGQVFFDGPTVRTAHGDIPVDLYAPRNFELGSSFSHLDEQAFPPGDPNSLMTPFLARSEAIHSPGAVTCAIFQDIGWELGDDCLALFPSLLATFVVEARGQDDVLLTWDVSPGTEPVQFEIQQQYFDEPFETIEVLSEADIDEQAGTFSFLVEDLEPGRYTFRVVATDVSGVTAVSSEEEIFIEVPGSFVLSEPFPNPFLDEVQLLLLVDRAQRVTARVFDVSGRQVAVLFEGLARPEDRLQLRFDPEGLPNGVYLIQVTGEFFNTTDTAVLLR